MKGAIKRRPYEVMHPRIDNHEGLAARALLNILYSGYQEPRLPRQEPAGFENEGDIGNPGKGGVISLVRVNPGGIERLGNGVSWSWGARADKWRW